MLDVNATQLDTMVSAHSRDIGKAGEGVVKQFFSIRGFGVVEYPQDDDLGTDLLLDVREPVVGGGSKDLSFSVRCQVKTGDSYLGHPAHITLGNEGEVEGFWFYCDVCHHNYWTRHRDRFFLIIQGEDAIGELNSQHRYWQWIDAEDLYQEVVPRSSDELHQGVPSGYRLFVPSSHVVDDTFCRHLIQLANDYQMEQSLLHADTYSFDITSCPEWQRARYALLLPDLVKPHVNRGIDHAICWAEALALCVSRDAQRWSNGWYGFAEKYDQVPTPKEAKTSADMGWRFTGEFHSLVYGDEPDGFEKMAELPPELEVSKLVVLASIAYREQRFGDVVSTIDETFARLQDIDDVDRAWILLHRGNALCELAEWDRARDDYTEARRLTAAASLDLTAKLLHGVASVATYRLEPFGGQDIGSFVAARDNELSRFSLRRDVATLEHVLKERFDDWSPSGKVTFAAHDTVEVNYQTQASVSLLAGDVPAYRAALSEMTLIELSVRGVRGACATSCMGRLVRAGDHEHLGQALRRGRYDIEPDVLVSFANSYDPRDATSTTLRPLCTLVQVYGEYLSVGRTESWFDFFSQALRDPGRFVIRFSKPGYYAGWPSEAIKCIASMRYQLSEEQLNNAVTLVCSGSVDLEIVSGQIELLLDMAKAKNCGIDVMRVNAGESNTPAWLKTLIGRVLYEGSVKNRTEIHHELINGDFRRIDKVGGIENFDAVEVESIVSKSIGVLETIASESDEGHYSHRVVDYGWFAAMFLLESDKQPYWDSIIDFLTRPLIRNREKVSIARVFLGRIDKMPKHRAASILAHEEVIMHSLDKGARLFAEDSKGVVQAMMVALHGVVEGFDVAIRSAMAGGCRFDENTVPLLKYTGQPEVTLLSLCQHDDYRIRYKAFETLVSVCCMDESRYADFEVMFSSWCLGGGADYARAFINATYGKSGLTHGAKRLLATLREGHPSAIARYHAGVRLGNA